MAGLQPATRIAPGTALRDALRALRETGGDAVLITNETRLRQQDLLAYVAEAFPESILNLPPRPHQLMEEQDAR